MPWLLLLVLLTGRAAGGAVYVIRRFHRFDFLQRLGEKHRILSWLLALLPVAACAAFCWINVYAAVIVFLHLVLFWLLCDFAAFLVQKRTKKERRPSFAGTAAMIITVIYLGFGWFFAHHVFRTDYTFRTEKKLGGSLRIAEIADSHLGITLDGEDFAREMQKVQAAEPDVVVIVGDFVDDDTRKADMEIACRALGDLRATYGVYFVFGNHDKAYFNYRDFTSEDLRSALSENGVVILEDEAVLIDGRFYLIGRQDRSVPDRADMETLTEGLYSDMYQIVLDHQPNDYADESAAEVDLVLSGHTHGGHIFPAGVIGRLIGANDRVYGTEVRGKTTFLVTSGISGWAIPFKTGTISEFVIIDVVGK